MTPQPDDPEGIYAEMDALRRYVAIRTGGSGNGNVYIEPPSGGSKLTNTLLGILSALVVAEMLGGVGLYAKVEALQTTMQLIVDGKILIVKVP
jgi:hypothetical protein